ncbi:MAG: hypothetical protein QM796_18400 [Chthoniobacteraceae bacterium]
MQSLIAFLVQQQGQWCANVAAVLVSLLMAFIARHVPGLAAAINPDQLTGYLAMLLVAGVNVVLHQIQGRHIAEAQSAIAKVAPGFVVDRYFGPQSSAAVQTIVNAATKLAVKPATTPTP